MEYLVRTLQEILSAFKSFPSATRDTMFQFVHKKGSGSGNDREDPENIRLIRSHAMQHVRRRERVGREGEEATGISPLSAELNLD